MTATIMSLLTFAFAVVLATASPGPTVAALVTRVMGMGLPGIPAFCAGLVIGDVIWLAAAVFGLSVLAQTAQPLFYFAKYLGAAYLLWLAFKLWTSAPELPQKQEKEPSQKGIRLFAAGLALALGNPKTMVFYIALAPALFRLSDLSVIDFLLFESVLVAAYSAVLSAYVILAARARKFIRSSTAVRRVNRATGAVMAGAAGLVAIR